MSVFRPQYKDKRTGKLQHTRVWYYKFIFTGRLLKESAKTTSKTVAKEAEKRRRRALEEAFNGLTDVRDDRIRIIGELADGFLKEYSVRQPKSTSFAEHALIHVKRLLGEVMVVDEKAIVKYQGDRLGEKAAPKTINEEVGFLLRLLPIAHAGAIRAQLKQQKRLNLKVPKQVGKAYSPEEKAQLIEAARTAKRSKGFLLATMLAQHTGLRDKEIRTLQWSGFDLVKRVLTVGDSKTDAGTGRTIPMNEDLYVIAIDYAKWYTGRFGALQSEWYVFPTGRPRPNDPTRPQTSLKTAWRIARKRASVEGRFHDNRHSFITDLAESGAPDEVIRDLAGHVSKDMLKRYSHIRMQAKRRAVGALDKREVHGAGIQKPQPHETSEALVQDSVQVMAGELARRSDFSA